MAVYTNLAEEEIADFIALYDIGELVAAKGIAEGVENSNYLIQTQPIAANHPTPYILTLFEKRVKEADLPFFIGLMEHLAARGLPVPSPLVDRQGRILQRLAERPALIVSFLTGLSRRRPQPQHCRELGESLAKLHLASAGFGLQRANALNQAAWQPLYQRCDPTEVSLLAKHLPQEIEPELARLAQAWPKPHELAWGVIHADLFPNNVFFTGEKLSGMIDFYFACEDFLAYDLAICLTSWCFEADGSFNLTKGGAMLKAYHAVRPLSAEEQHYLPLLACGCAMRFLLTRLYDWINTPKTALVVKLNPLEYLSYLRFHQNVRSLADYGFS